jgi:glucose-1-phosphate cytidylyltransferase
MIKLKRAVILAGGLGSRLAEETQIRPKPMVEIGGRPILWHIMKIYSHFGVREFIICCGYKGYVIKEYFQNYLLHMSDVTFDFTQSDTIVHDKRTEPWKVTLVDTGDATMTGGRLKRIARFLDDEPFGMTYGDGVADVDLNSLISFHAAHNCMATVTVVRPPGRFGAVEMQGDLVRGFAEKPPGEAGWINAGFFVLSPKVLTLIQSDDTVWERGPMETLAATGQLSAYKHGGFWKPMDTLRDKQELEALWAGGHAPWHLWGHSE